ncbi:enoyl-CoA hydratase [Bradyrhizobium sp. LHD-71]|uniref:enoyl-CoA hydratase n=1 Tax=Bradyrhizobium sp. LHD-71 TaxID=3072141 RepID=UPI002810458B|nr:enoyl-CoA hydratase [Bradyrhizobium sp. LHD-71]MDQ8732737.1 enoyl-CoA hydratase [Bradyrhizobium sp. LHD-71]
MNIAAKSTAKEYADGKILQSVSDGIGILTFNNPEKRNAMSIEMWEAAAEVLEVFRDDPNVRVVVLVGAGGKAFVSGADISQFEKNRNNAAASEEYARRSGRPREMLAAFPKPTIACIQGFCMGGGLALAMSADMRIAAEGSQFGIPAAKLSIAYGYDALTHLVQLVGPSRARLLMFTAGRIDASEAYNIGLIDRLVSETDLWNATMEIAQQIAENAPLAISAAKITIAEILKDASQRDMQAIKDIGTTCMDSEDFKEGRTAFMAKRKPQFKGR